MSEFMQDVLYLLNFTEAIVISMAVFIADFLTGVTAGLRSGRHITSTIMHQSLSKKVSNYFFFLIIGLAFYIASTVGYTTAPLRQLAAVITLIPAMPELLSVFENIKIMWTKKDTKSKKWDNDNDYK